MKFEMEKVFATMSVISFRNYFQLILYSTKYLILDVLKLTRKRTTRYWCSVFVHRFAIYFVLNSFQKTVILILRINAGCYCSFYQVKKLEIRYFTVYVLWFSFKNMLYVYVSSLCLF